MALNLIDRMVAGGIPIAPIVVDSGYGDNGPLRALLDLLGIEYVARINGKTTVPVGDEPSGPPASVQRLAARLPRCIAQRVSRREGTKGTMTARFAMLLCWGLATKVRRFALPQTHAPDRMGRWRQRAAHALAGRPAQPHPSQALGSSGAHPTASRSSRREFQASATARPRRRARTGEVEPSRLHHLFGGACVSGGCGRTRARSDRDRVRLRPGRHTPTLLATAHMVLLSAAADFLTRCPLCKTHFLTYEREPGRHPCAIPRPSRGWRPRRRW